MPPGYVCHSGGHGAKQQYAHVLFGTLKLRIVKAPFKARCVKGIGYSQSRTCRYPTLVNIPVKVLEFTFGRAFGIVCISL